MTTASPEDRERIAVKLLEHAETAAQTGQRILAFRALTALRLEGDEWEAREALANRLETLTAETEDPELLEQLLPLLGLLRDEELRDPDKAHAAAAELRDQASPRATGRAPGAPASAASTGGELPLGVTGSPAAAEFDDDPVAAFFNAPPPGRSSVSVAARQQPLMVTGPIEYDAITDLESKKSPVGFWVVVGVVALVFFGGAYLLLGDDCDTARKGPSPELILLLILVGAAAVAFIIYKLKQQHDTKEALVETCLLCNSKDVVALATGRGMDDYRCQRCGYDTRMAERPDLASLLVQFQDLKNAVSYMESAQKALARAQMSAAMDSSMKYEHLERSNQAMREGMSLLQSLLSSYPGLLQVPVAGASLSDGTVVADIFSDSLGATSEVYQAIQSDKLDLDLYLHTLHSVLAYLRQQILAQR